MAIFALGVGLDALTGTAGPESFHPQLGRAFPGGDSFVVGPGADTLCFARPPEHQSYAAAAMLLLDPGIVAGSTIS